MRASRRAASACGTTNRPQAWKRIVDFVHHNDAGQGRHAARPCRPQGLDQARLGGRSTSRSTAGNWPLISASALPYLQDGQMPRAMDRDRHGPREGRLRRARRERAARTGVRLLELHCAHGYLLSSFLSPLTNHARRRIWRQPREPRALSARNLSRRSALSGRRTSRSRCASPVTTGSRAATRRRMPRSSRRCSRRPAPT